MPFNHLAVSLAALVASLALSAFTVNRVVKRKLRLSIFLLLAVAVMRTAMALRPQLLPVEGSEFYSFEQLALAAALINPLRIDRVPDRFPSIVQDAIVIGMLILVATFALGDRLLATSAVSAVVIGFALQDTLGNAFAGLALQSEKPFSVGHWVTVGEFEGRVAEVTWRATKLRTKSGNFVIVPNSEVAKAAITNYSEPAAPTRLFVEVGVSYDTPPNRAKAVLLEAVSNCPVALKAPAPDVVFIDFADFSLNFRVRFWVEDYERDEFARDQVRTAIYYALRRAGIEIPFPITTEIQKEWQGPDERARIAEREAMIAGVDLFGPLDTEQRRMLASKTRSLVYADGETIVGQGQPGESMFVVCSGEVGIHVDGQQEPIAVTKEGGYFGEMSVLTGAPRTASVRARGDVVLLEIGADAFRQLADVSPQAVEQIGAAAAARRLEIDRMRSTTTAGAVAVAPATFVERMRRFLRMHPPRR